MSRINNIWIIDDDKLYTVLSTKIILKIDPLIQIDSFPQGEAALAELNKTSNLPDIIFLDINMPIMDGWEFLNEYQNIKSKLVKSIQIYAVSSSISSSDIEKSTHYPEIKEYLVKPLKKEKIIELIGNQM